MTVAEVWNQGNWSLKYRRFLSNRQRGLEQEMINFLKDKLMVNGGADVPKWRFNALGIYTVKSLYKFLNHGGILPTVIPDLWKIKIPLKIRVFLWLVCNNKVLTRVNLVRRGWSGSTDYVFFRKEKITRDLFLKCTYIKEIWKWI